MEKTCKTLEGPDFDNDHKELVDNFIEKNPLLFKPISITTEDTSEEPSNDSSNIDDPVNTQSDTNQNDPNELIVDSITLDEVKKIIKKMPNKAPGDKVYPKHLKNGTEKLFKILMKIFNISKDLGYFPDQWKKSFISMILKPGKNPSLPGSYRPISLLPVIGKLLEGIMASRLVKYMVSKNLINKYQCGFRSKKSCVHQLLRLS